MAEARMAEQWPVTKHNAALIIIDMQNMWVHPKGNRYLPTSEDIIPKIQELSDFCRRSRVPIIYLYTTKRKDLADVGIFGDVKPGTHNVEDPWTNVEGEIGGEILESLKPVDTDIVIKKFRYSGFYGTQLENVLRRLKRDVIAITGVATNVCCDATAKDGAMRDFKVLFLSDANATFTEEDQDYTLRNFEKHYGVVMDSETFMRKVDHG
jgi:nicotinamidase-related amidase